MAKDPRLNQKCPDCGVDLYAEDIVLWNGRGAELGVLRSNHFPGSPSCMRRQVEQKDDRIAELEEGIHALYEQLVGCKKEAK